MSNTRIADLLIKAFHQGNKLLIAGNGGSAAMSIHFAAELIGHMSKNRPALPAISLNTDISILTAVGNDYKFEDVFSRQIEALGQEGDIFIGLTTSGTSKNILKASQVAGDKGMIVIILEPQGKPASKIQEIHLKKIHQICQKVEDAFCANN